MPEIGTVTILQRKRKQIAASFKLYKRQLAQARLDLSRVYASVILPGSLSAVPLGVAAAHKLKGEKLRLLFCGFLIFSATMIIAGH